MNTFSSYSRYYDLLYRDKDYVKEAQFVQKLLQKYAVGAKSILELGCGTGTHAALLAKEEYQVHGVDLSADMLQRATDRLSHLPKELASRLEFSQGDIRTIRINKQFDAVISLFHVISYQTTHEDLQAAFSTAKAHLKPGGVFIFDCWYGPAVLSDRPVVRVKRIEDEEIAVTRIADPVMYPNQNIVDVNYQILIKHKLNGRVEELCECHRMRYLFIPEIQELFSSINLKIITFGKWMTNHKPTFNTWSVYFIVSE